MTVGELICELQKLPANLLVVTWNPAACGYKAVNQPQLRDFWVAGDEAINGQAVAEDTRTVEIF